MVSVNSSFTFAIILMIGVLVGVQSTSSFTWGVCDNILSSNMMLLNQSPTRQTRLKAASVPFFNLDADVICAQEFWQGDDVKRMTENVRNVLPYSFSPIHKKVNELDLSTNIPPACDTATDGPAFQGMVQCLNRHGCSSPNPLQIGTCIAKKCKTELHAVGELCLSCVFLNMADTIPVAFQTCARISGERRFNPPGLLLMSRHNILKARYESFYPGRRTVLQRGYIEADIENVGKVVCTHLSSYFGPFYVEYNSSFTSYGQQNMYEVQRLSETFNGVDHILVGDLNISPGKTNLTDAERNIDARFQKSYNYLINQGYRSPYVEKDGRCTFCRSNPSRPAVQVDTANSIYDHVLLKGDRYLNQSMAMRVMDRVTPFPYSDHYGVKVGVCQRRVFDPTNDL